MSWQKISNLMYNKGRMSTKEQHEVRLARLRTIKNIFANEISDVYTLAIRFGVYPTVIHQDLKLLRSLKLLPSSNEAEICKLCHEHRKLVTHHWTDESGFHTKRICSTCNTKLGIIFRGNYPIWKEQAEILNAGWTDIILGKPKKFAS